MSTSEENKKRQQEKTNPLKLVNEIVIGIYTQISGLEHELSTVVNMQQRSLTEKNTPQAAFAELYEHVNDIRTRAAMAEIAIQTILSDPTKAEYAKSRLMETSASINELFTLARAHGDLEFEIMGEYNYERIANLLKRINGALVTLERYVLVKRIDELKRQYALTKATIRRKVFSTFREIGQIMDAVPNEGTIQQHYSDPIIASLKNAHLVIECLGQDTVDDLMAELVQTQLLPYDKMGRDGGALFKLEKEAFERRWAGLRRLLYAADSRTKDICPPSWMFPHRLYIEFCERTARHLRSLLSSDYNRYVAAALSGVDPSITNQSNYNILSTSIGLQETQDHVGRIVNALKSVLSIEEEMNNRFEEDTLSLHAQSKIEEDVLAKLTQGSLISYIFEDYMTPYVQLERKTLDDTVRGLISQDDESNIALANTIKASTLSSSSGSSLTPSKDNNKDNGNNNNNNGGSSGNNSNMNPDQSDLLASAAHTLYDSAGRLFETIRQSMRRCLALSNGKPFLLLVNEYRGSIQMYSESLISKFPKVDYPPVTKALVNVGGSKAPPYKMPLEDEIVICRVISTAEYCANVIPNLESQIKSKINIILEKEINFSDQCDKFTDVIANAIDLLVKGIMSHTETVIKIIKKIKWDSLSSVDDESSYIPVIKTILFDCIPRIRHALTPIWFKNFCTKYATEFLDQYLNVIMSQKRICPIGAEQLLLDTNALKTLFLSLHHLNITSEMKSEYVIPTTYTTLVGSRLKHIEVILKLVCTPDDQFEEMFAIMWPEGEPSDMQAIFNLKHNNTPSVITSTANVVDKIGDISVAATRGTVGAVGDLSAATTRGVVDGTKTAFGATKNAFGATKNAIGAVGSTSKALSGSVQKTFSAIKISQSLKNVTKNLQGDEGS